MGKAFQFLAELVLVSQWGEISSKTGTKQTVGVLGAGLAGDRTRPPLPGGGKSPSLVGLSPFTERNAEDWEMLSWGFALQPHKAYEDQGC